MKDKFLNIDQSLALREMGFDDVCFALFKSPYKQLIPIDNQAQNKISDKYGIGAPLLQDAFNFFTEKYGVCGYVVPYTDIAGNNGYVYMVKINFCSVNNIEHKIYEKYKDAQYACIDYLIEIIKSINEKKNRNK